MRFAPANGGVTVISREKRAPIPRLLEFRLLGPLEVRDGERTPPLSGLKQRAVLRGRTEEAVGAVRQAVTLFDQKGNVVSAEAAGGLLPTLARPS
jgi:hypothetical protein